MTHVAAPSLSQIKAQIAAIRHKIPQAKVIGIQSPGRWSGESVQRDGDEEFIIYQCDSPLSFRLALRQPVDASITRILITGLDEQDLGEDVLLRLTKRRLFRINAWQIVRSLFDARAVDPRLSRHGWIAKSLLELVPRQGFTAARGGFLDAETVWPLLLGESIGLRTETPDIISLLKWSMDSTLTVKFGQCSPEFREGAIGWLTEKAGPVAEIILRYLERHDQSEAVSIGLSAAVIYHPLASGKLEKATGKLEERFLGGSSPDPDHMRRWSAAATEVVRSIRSSNSRISRQAIQRADEILREIQADGMAHLSDTSALGFDQRLAHVGERLREVVDRGSWNELGQVLDARQQVRLHDNSILETRRLERVDMALRLARWLRRWQQYPTDSQSLAEASDYHLREGGFIDWARLSLRSGDSDRTLSEAYSRLFDQVTRVRQQQNQAFAELLRDWTSAGARESGFIPVERILDEIVAPLAAEGLVLVVVVDGMSVAVCRELLADVTRHDWIAISEPGKSFNRAGLATIPSVTEFSRTSLLCGTLRQGGQDDEKTGFADHPSLVARSRSGSPPILFHKAGLQETDASTLAADVRKEIASTHRRVVGVVVNAVDDHLLKGEQIDTRWTRDEIKVLPALLHEARIARRIVVLVSDHGHVLDCRSEGRPNRDHLPGGERWRSAEGTAAADELLVEGGRVLASGHRLLAPWSECVRYGIKKNGYHGGLTPQEMVTPITVLSSTDDFPKGWSEQPIDTPVWWDESSPPLVTIPPLIPKLKPSKPQPSGTLFDLEGAETAPAGTDTATPQWISQLLACPVFAEQKRLGGRGAPADQVLIKLLISLELRGWKMTSAALARALEYPEIRLPGLLANAERIFNVDGYDVLRRDDVSNTIELNRELLLKQFDLVE